MADLAIVSGGTRGLGRALSTLLAAKKIPVFALYHKDEAAAKALVAQCPKVEAIRCDVTADNGALKRRLADVSNADVLFIHNASASFVPQPFHLFSWADFETQWRVAVEGMWKISHALLPIMASSKKGTIVSVLTEALGDSPKGFAPYLAAKGALLELTRSLAAERARAGVKIFSVSPGFMDTDLTRAWPETLRMKQTRSVTPDWVATQILEKVFDPNTPGQGEDHRFHHDFAKTA